MDTREISTKLRFRVLARDNYRCRYCGQQANTFHMDHVYLYSKGGETTYDNLVTACQKCNLKKHNTVGMWPKPVGYFDNKNQKRHSLYITLITMFGVAFMINGVLLLRGGNDLFGSIFFIAGMAVSIFSITANLMRP